MLTTLYVLVSHALFDWSARKSPSGLAKNFGDIIQDSFGVSPDISSASSIYRGARMFYDLARKKKNLKRSKGAVIKSEEVNLKGIIKRKCLFSKEESLLFEPVMFQDVKGFSFSPMHMTMR